MVAPSTTETALSEKMSTENEEIVDKSPKLFKCNIIFLMIKNRSLKSVIINID